MKPKQAVKIDEAGNNKKVYFGDDGQVVDKPVVKQKIAKVPKVVVENETSEVLEKPKKSFKKYQQNGEDLETRWYQFYEEHNTSEFKEIKDSELKTLQTFCRNCFNEEIQNLSKSE